MALVRSSLNPNAPLFIPAAVRKVEDFSPEWWQLVTNSTWYRNYWLSLNPEGGVHDADEEGIWGGDAVEMLPDFFDLDAGEDFSAIEAQYEEFLQLSENGDYESNGIVGGATKLSIVKSRCADGRGRRATYPAKYSEKPAKNVNSKCSPRCIQQPR
ncbi:hypothetical protein MLD38_028810 [Melastoma candidum]|uniref:Uncharacterized protein n=1 Tax=Melastoma candidum TaxID=119954 RepID=A0ACB9N3F8_9MYRT|nr:hypothetical protein MLD38_028810 [Melastoma candidum]